MNAKDQIAALPIQACFAYLHSQHPLIHSITSTVAINDCANAILALGAQPICAEHPKEAAGITRMADALTVSLANITDARMESILISGEAALEARIPSVMDAVGVTCSPLRRDLADRFIRTCQPSVIKGNVSEIRALAGVSYESAGIDAGASDSADLRHPNRLSGSASLVLNYARKTGSVVLASGAVDILSDGTNVYLVENGCPAMSRVTGTGCILTCIIGSFLAAADPLTAALLSTSLWGLCGEISDTLHRPQGLGSFHIGLLDALSTITADTLERGMRIVPYDPLP